MTDAVHIRPVATMAVTPDQFGDIHRAALQLAARAGFRTPSEALRARVTGRRGFRVEGTRIHPSEVRLAAFLAEHRARHSDPPPDPARLPILWATDRPLYAVAADGVTIRPFTRQDAVDGAKLVCMLHDRGVRGGTTGLPSDVDPRLAPFEQVLIALRYGRCGGSSSHVFTLWHTRYMEEIVRVQGQPFGLSVWMPSPFRLEGNELDIVLAMEGHFVSLGVGSMPIMA